ncbi:MAG TPA: tryptophan dimethylallyltransferase family protein [Polyangiaceae bacterium]|nr:tryptophan dimethylallyltransferase family protein [Polyangiaceae bacterium]
MPRLRRLCEALGMEQDSEHIAGVFRRLVAPWGATPPLDAPPWLSEVGDDHTPFEFSAAFGTRNELRILVEPLGNPAGLIANRDRALAVLDDLAKDHQLSFERLRRIEDLFLPEDPQGLFSIWLGVSFFSNAPADVKIYLNPEAQGPAKAAQLVEEAMVRLGFSNAWPKIASSIGRRGRELDELKYFSLDLAPRPESRVKVYVRHLAATVADVERAASNARSHRAGDVSEFVEATSGNTSGVFGGRPPATCLSFVEKMGNEPAVATHHFPVNGGYAANDTEVASRLVRYMTKKGLPVATYERALAAMAERSPAAGIGLQSYASFRREGEQIRLTVYFPLELYQPGKIASASARRAPTTPAEIVERFEQEPLADHPFMRRLRREPVDLYKLWKLMKNAQIGIINGFSRRLSQVVAKVDDDRIRSILAHQLNDELGNGQFERAHSQLFGKLVAGLDRWKADVVDEALLKPGQNLSRGLEEIYFTSDAFEGVGATMVIEIFGRQVDMFFGDEFRRQKEVDPKSLEWLNMHEELEVEHSAESMELAHLVPAESLPALWRGARRVNDVSTAFFDEMYGVCFG